MPGTQQADQERGRGDEDLPFVSIIIPHLNQVEQGLQCLASLAAQTYPLHRTETILVDNGSTDDLTPLRNAFPNVRILSEDVPGPGPARNCGAAAARGNVLAFIDADCRAHPSWLAEAVAALHRPEATGVVGGDVRIGFVDPARLTPLEAYEAVFAYQQQKYIETLRFSGTGNLAIGAQVLRDVGPFAGIDLAEDADWGRRATAAGYPPRYAPAMIVYHPARTRSSQLQAKWRRHVAHQLSEHRGGGRPPWLWTARAFAVLLSPFLHWTKLALTDRVAGLRNKAKGALILFRIRFFRFKQMLAQARETRSAAREWNRRSTH